MKRIVSLLAAVSLAMCAVSAHAQTAGEPDAQSVLEKAREEYNSPDQPEIPDQPESPEAPGIPESPAPSREGETSEYEFTPFQVSWVPGIGEPGGIRNVGIALGCIGTITGNVDGFAAATIFNIADGYVRGFQGTGVFNIADGYVQGFQGSGVFNIGANVDGFQVAGVFNIAENVQGFQVAGVLNAAGKTDGIQVSGVVNIAETNSGAMIGLVNVAERADGLVLGLVNVVGNGIYSGIAWYEFDSRMCYGGIQTGTPFLYGVYYAGALRDDLFERAESFVAGMAIGHRFGDRGSYIDLDVGCESNIGPRLDGLEAAAGSDGPRCSSDWQPWVSARLTAGFPLAGRLEIFGGLKVDADFMGADNVPVFLRNGTSGEQGRDGNILGLDCRAWPKFFLGLKI
ncbi:MAG: hypothetical protein NT080_11260 [Spirochaetes bacterium]|nr:hypothetical protein [Spirochaetota bacterium]